MQENLVFRHTSEPTWIKVAIIVLWAVCDVVPFLFTPSANVAIVRHLRLLWILKSTSTLVHHASLNLLHLTISSSDSFHLIH